MKSIKLLSVLALFFTVVLFQSCETDPCEDITCLNDGICLDGTCDCPDGYSGSDCGTHCSADLAGTWNVTSTTGDPILCNLTTYELTVGTTISDMNITVTDASGLTGSGTGTLSADCSTLTYDIANGLITGTITFNGNSFTDVVDQGCTFEASK